MFFIILKKFVFKNQSSQLFFIRFMYKISQVNCFSLDSCIHHETF